MIEIIPEKQMCIHIITLMTVSIHFIRVYIIYVWDTTLYVRCTYAVFRNSDVRRGVFNADIL